MFQIAKLKNQVNEEVDISYVTQEHCCHNEDGTITKDIFDTLCFDIIGDEYSFTFTLNCRLEKLLDIPMHETIDFKEYIMTGETWLAIKGLYDVVDPKMYITITRYLRNKFIIVINFNTEYGWYDDDIYAGIIELSFDLDEYIK